MLIACVVLIIFWYSSNSAFVGYWLKDRTRGSEPFTLLLGSSSIARLPVNILKDCSFSQKYGFNNGETDDIAKYLRFAEIGNAEHILIYIGENDIARGKSVEKTFSEHQTLIETIQRQSAAPIGVITLKLSPARYNTHNQIREFNKLLLAEYSASKRIMLVPYHTFTDPRLYVSDGIHLNGKGTQRFANLINQFCSDF